MIELEDIIREYSHFITEDSFVVGIDQRGNLCLSDFRHIPHRLIAGVTGMGKTNFIRSVIYQFLYANSQREIWIADFKRAVNYQIISHFHPSIRIVTDLNDFSNLLKELWSEHENRLELIVSNIISNLNESKQKEGIKIPRKLLIIDEGSSIMSAEREVKKDIDKDLRNLAAQSRETGINIIYCTQRPTPEVIPTYITDNMDERIIFRVQSGASMMLLGNDSAASLPVKPKGRAIYRGIDEELKIIATPYVPDKMWQNSL